MACLNFTVLVCGDGDGRAEGDVVEEFRDAGFTVVGFEEGGEAVGGIGAEVDVGEDFVDVGVYVGNVE